MKLKIKFKRFLIKKIFSENEMMTIKTALSTFANRHKKFSEDSKRKGGDGFNEKEIYYSILRFKNKYFNSSYEL